MPWTCDCCGWENPVDDHPARYKIPCIRCGRPRGSRAATIAELEIEIEDLIQDRESLKKRLYHLQEIITALEHDLGQYTSQRSDLVEEIRETSAILARSEEILANIRAYRPGCRQISGDQRTLEVSS